MAVTLRKSIAHLDGLFFVSLHFTVVEYGFPAGLAGCWCSPRRQPKRWNVLPNL